jgi:phosphate transport system substrate-binding protein
MRSAPSVVRLPSKVIGCLLAGLAASLPLHAAAAAEGELQSYAPHAVTVPKDASYVLPDGSIYIVGNDGMKGMLAKFNEIFARTHPGFKFTMLLEGSSTGIGGLTAGVSAFAPMGREAWPTDLSGFREFYDYLPTDLHIGRAGYIRPGQKNPPAIYVNARNPLAGLTLEQVARIFTRGADKGDIARWNALGLGGDWGKRAIHVYGTRDDGGLPTSLRIALLGGRQFARSYEPLENFAAVIKAVAADPYGIGLAGWFNIEAFSANVKLVPLAAKDGVPYASPTYENVLAGKYPFSPHLHFYVNRAPDKPLDPFIKEYARLVLSKEGQAIIEAEKDGDEAYMPLNRTEVAEQLARLE